MALGKLAPTGMKSAPPSREQLKKADDEAWQLYDLTCWRVDATEDDRCKAFQAALDTMNAILEFDQRLLFAP